MGLAYNLDVEYWETMSKYISPAFSQQGNDTKNAQGDRRPNSGCFDPPDWGFLWNDQPADPTEIGCQQIFPTGEYIIRDCVFINGFFVFCGSYKAFFKDLYGAGNDGYAWDGFLMPMRGYSNNTAAGTLFEWVKNTGEFVGVSNDREIAGFGILPMRFPLNIQPSAIGDAAATAADSSVGLQAIDIYKSRGTPFVGLGDFFGQAISIMSCGFQLVGDPVAQGMKFSDIDYVGFLTFGALLFFGSGQGEEPSPQNPAGRDISGPLFLGVSQPGQTQYGDYTEAEKANIQYGDAGMLNSRGSAMVQVGWKITTNNSFPNFNNTDRQNLRDLDVWLALDYAQQQNVGGEPYLYRNWLEGYTPSGLPVPNPLNLPADDPALAGVTSAAATVDNFPRRFMDITTYASVGFGVGEKESIFCISGDMSVGLDVLGNAVQTVPMVIGGAFPYDILEALMALGQDPATPPINFSFQYAGPYMICHVAGVSALSQVITIPGSAVGQNVWSPLPTANPTSIFANSYAAFSIVPYEAMGTPNAGVDASGALIYTAVNGMLDADGNTNGAIFVSGSFEDGPLGVECPFNNIALVGTVSEANTVMPTKWIGKAAQSRTFSPIEEEGAKGILSAIDSGRNDSFEYLTIRNSNTPDSELVGYKSNYQRYGLDGDENSQRIQSSTIKGAGSPTGQGFGFLGYKTGVGPILLMLDSGGGIYTNAFTIPTTANPTYSNIGALLNKGNDLNANTLPVTVPANVTRMALNCGWDNDRDQWLFCEQDPTLGTSIISVNAAFGATTNDNGFLDQTDNFVGPSPGFRTADCHSSLFVPFLMTNNLDGIVVMGGDDATSSGTGTQFGNTDLTVFGLHGINDGAGVATTTDPVGGCDAITYTVQNQQASFYKISGSTGRTASVWVDYVLFDGADALIATKLRERGMKVTIEAVEWFKRKIINSGDLNISAEEIEIWMREQQNEFSQMMQDAERQGRVRIKKKQVSAYGIDMSEVITPDFEDKEMQEFMKDYLPTSRPPTPEELRLEKQRKGGYSPEQNSYFDEVFED